MRRGTDRVFACAESSAGLEVWKLIFELVRNLNEVILQTLPSFWKVAKGYMEGKYQKVRMLSLLLVLLACLTDISPERPRRRTPPLPTRPPRVAVPPNVASCRKTLSPSTSPSSHPSSPSLHQPIPHPSRSTRQPQILPRRLLSHLSYRPFPTLRPIVIGYSKLSTRSPSVLTSFRRLSWRVRLVLA